MLIDVIERKVSQCVYILNSFIKTTVCVTPSFALINNCVLPLKLVSE